MILCYISGIGVGKCWNNIRQYQYLGCVHGTLHAKFHRDRIIIKQDKGQTGNAGLTRKVGKWCEESAY